MPAAAVIPWGLLNMFGIGSYIVSLIDLSPGLKRSERDSDHSVPSVMKQALYAS